MEVTLELNGKKVKAKVAFAQPADFGFAQTWRKSIGDDKNPFRTDAVEFAVLAIKRFEASAGLGIYASSLGDFSDHIACDPKVEVGGFVVLRCDWFPDSEIIGFSHFRRTWCNKIILDYLAVHPLIVRPKDGATHKVRGVGTALMYFITQVLKQENCPTLWGEATSLSAPFYQKVCKLEHVDDLIFAPRDNLIMFAEETEREWSVAGDVVTTPNQPLDAIYALEIENPPFIGSKMAVFNPSKILSYRFLKLAYHKQMEIAKKLHIIKSDAADIPRDALAQIVFKGARKKEILSALWDLVAKEHGSDTSEENPFDTNKK